MIAIIAWGTMAAKLGIPVSKSHALLAGLAGAGFAGGGFDALQWYGWEKVGIGMILSLGLGFVAAFLLARLIIRFAASASPHHAKRLFDFLQMGSAAFLAFNHGLNDGQKFMGVFALTLLAGGCDFRVLHPVVGDRDLRPHHGPGHQRRRLAHHQDRWRKDGAIDVVARFCGDDGGVEHDLCRIDLRRAALDDPYYHERHRRGGCRQAHVGRSLGRPA